MENLNEVKDLLTAKLDELQSAQKADVAEISKTVNQLKATVTALGGDADRDIKVPVFSSKKSMEAYKGEVVRAFEKAGVWNKIENGDKARENWIGKASGLNSTDSTAGLYFVQTSVDSEISKLVQQAGVARANCRMRTGLTGPVVLNKRTGLPTAAYTVASAAIRADATVTPSAATYDKVTLTPSQASAITTVEEKLIHDSVPNVLQDTAEELAEAFAIFEDTCLFKGDGSVTYNSFTGLSTTTEITSDLASTAAAFTSPDPLLSLFTKVHVSVQRSGNAKFYMHPYVWALITAKKNSTTNAYWFDIAASSWVIAGTPVEFVNVMDSTIATGTVPVIYGNMSKAVSMGIGRDSNLRALNELYAASNSIGLKYTEDFGFALVQPSAVTRLRITS